MNPDDRTKIDALVLRLGRIEALIDVIARTDDSRMGEALRGVADMLAELVDQLDAFAAPGGAA